MGRARARVRARARIRGGGLPREEAHGLGLEEGGKIWLRGHIGKSFWGMDDDGWQVGKVG